MNVYQKPFIPLICAQLHLSSAGVTDSLNMFFSFLISELQKHLRCYNSADKDRLSDEIGFFLEVGASSVYSLCRAR